VTGASPLPGFVALGRLDDFPDGSASARAVAARRLAVYRVGDDVFALKDICPHQGDALHRLPPEAGAAVCIGHGWRFDLRTGRCLRGDPEARIAVYPVRVVDGTVYVQLGR